MKGEETAMQERGAIASRTLPDGTVLDVCPWLHGYAILGSILPEDAGLNIYSDVWQYQSRQVALQALAVWDGTGEPLGWYRHPASGRRRPDGDPAREFVRP